MEDRADTSVPIGAGHEPTECDLVMKGGITSGVVYPSAVLRLKERYRLRNIGGASVGALAAVMTAAAAYGDQKNAGEGHGYDTLESVVDELGSSGFVLDLFQPTPDMKPAHTILIRLLKTGQESGGRGKTWRFIGVVGASQWVKAVIGAVLMLLVWFGLGTLGWWSNLIGAPSEWSIGAIVLAAATSIIVALVGAILGVGVGIAMAARRLYRRFENNGFGLCPGMRQPSFEGPGLSDWMHERIQDCAGLTATEPLTFGHLEDQGLHLETVTTNLNYSRPFRLPFEDTGRFLFRSEQLERVFPAEVVRWMESHPPQGSEPPEEGYHWVPPAADLPVIVAARMSLSFPGLISAVPLHAADQANPTEPKPIVPNWFSDGGISSNFPIHFFDGWLPARPTFGLNLGPYPTDRRGRPATDLEGMKKAAEDDWATGDVFMPASREDGQFPRWVHFSGPGGFIARILDTMENWRDNMQSELPGFRDRICEIRLDDDQGGMHLTMPPDRIEDLVRKGRMAGDRLLNNFNWEQHRWTRYLMLMETLQVRLEGDGSHPAKDAAHARFDQLYAATLESGPPEVRDYLEDHDNEWCRRANRATGRLLEASASWSLAPEQIRFDLTEHQVPAWVMRLTPKV